MVSQNLIQPFSFSPLGAGGFGTQGSVGLTGSPFGQATSAGFSTGLNNPIGFSPVATTPGAFGNGALISQVGALPISFGGGSSFGSSFGQSPSLGSFGGSFGGGSFGNSFGGSAFGSPFGQSFGSGLSPLQQQPSSFSISNNLFMPPNMLQQQQQQQLLQQQMLQQQMLQQYAAQQQLSQQSQQAAQAQQLQSIFQQGFQAGFQQATGGAGNLNQANAGFPNINVGGNLTLNNINLLGNIGNRGGGPQRPGFGGKPPLPAGPASESLSQPGSSSTGSSDLLPLMKQMVDLLSQVVKGNGGSAIHINNTNTNNVSSNSAANALSNTSSTTGGASVSPAPAPTAAASTGGY